MQAIEALAGAVDEGAGGGVLRGDAEVAGIAEGVHAFARGEEGVEAGVLGVLVLCRLCGGRGEGGDGVEWGGCFLLGEGGEGGGGGLLALVLGPGEGGGEGVVGARGRGLQGFWLGLWVRGPGVVCAGLRRADLLGLELVGEVVCLLGVGVAHGVESCRLRL